MHGVRSFDRSSGRRGQGRVQYPRSRCRWDWGPANRDVGRRACVARLAAWVGCSRTRFCRGLIRLALLSREIQGSGWRLPGFNRRVQLRRSIEVIENEGCLKLRTRRMPGARYEVIIDHAACLHECIYRGRPNKAKAVLLEVFRNRFRGVSGRWYFVESLEAIIDRAVFEVAPDQARQRLRFAKFQIGAGVVDRRLDLEAVAYNADVSHQPGLLTLAVACDAFRVEAVKCFAKVVSL